jgi:hypothetical protein
MRVSRLIILAQENGVAYLFECVCQGLKNSFETFARAARNTTLFFFIMRDTAA